MISSSVEVTGSFRDITAFSKSSLRCLPGAHENGNLTVVLHPALQELAFSGITPVQSSAFSNSSSGAFHVVWQHLTIKNTTFDNLEATSADATLHHNNTDGSFLAIDNCTFSNIYSLGNNLSVLVGIARPNMLMTNTQFIDCTASFAVVNIRKLPLFNGSYLANETATIDGCSFANCSASQGVLYMLGDNTMPAQQMNLYHSKFVGNQGFYGGAVTLFAVSVVQVFDCLFQDNYAMWGLSAFYVYGWVQQVTYFTMHNSVFVGNNGTRSALADPGQTGITDTAECGGLYLSSCKCVGIANSTFDSNTGIGLCVHGQLGSSPDCSNSDAVFFNQSTVAGPSDEAFLDHFLGRYDDLEITVDIRDSDFSDNTDAFLTRTTAEPDDVQPIDYLSGGAGLDIRETDMRSNTAEGGGGAVYCDGCILLTVNAVMLTGNSAGANGGALVVSGNGWTLSNISHSTFASNTAAQTESAPSTEGAPDGGAVSIFGGASLLSQNMFWNNSAAGHGGAVAYEDDCFTVYDTSEALSFLWSQLAPAMAALAGNCSFFISSTNHFSGNHADMADLVLIAAPGEYDLLIALPGFPQVPAAVLQNATYQARLDVEQALPSVDPECTLDDPWTSSDPDSYMRQLCTPGYYGPVSYVASALLVLAWLTYTIHVTLVENEEAAAGHADPQRTSQLIRALNLWLQYTTLLGGINIPAPKSVHWVFNAAQFAFATRILISLAVPVAMFVALVGIQVLRWHKGNHRPVSPSTSTAGHQSSSSAELRRRLLITLLEVLFYYFPSLLTTTLSLFACYHIDPSGPANAQYHNAQANWHNGYWLPDMTVQCFTGWHQRLAIILGTPLMALTWLVIPLLPAALLFFHRRNLDAPRIQLQLGYIYRVYRQACS
ncbi:hypothetical protein WJX79_001789 [Trebouxia sp. C0005]